MTKVVTKASGEHQKFDPAKFQRSLRRAGADEALIRQLTEQVLNNPNLTTTKEIYAFALGHLTHANPPVAARYSLKTAITQLGPSGFPFEHFIAEIFKQQGYATEVDKEFAGACVTHEVDVVIAKDDTQEIIECKFHQPHIRATVKIPLYIKARLDDIAKAHPTVTNAWCVTNTRFTEQAMSYGQCAKLKMLSWSQPEHNSLATIIDRLGLHPITALTSLSAAEKKELMLNGLVLCKDTDKFRQELLKLGMSAHKVDAVIREAQTACQLGEIE